MRRLFTMIAVAAMLLAGSGLLAAADATPGAGEAVAGESAVDELKVNINTDDAETIASGLKGIGQKRAEAIVQFRETNGPFSEASELAEIKGIGARIVEDNANLISVE